MERINGLRWDLNQRDRRTSAQRIRNGADYNSERQNIVTSITNRNNRYNSAVSAFRKYDANMQKNSLRTRGMYLKHQQHPQSIYMGMSNG